MPCNAKHITVSLLKANMTLGIDAWEMHMQWIHLRELTNVASFIGGSEDLQFEVLSS
jgi:hypothetical protein